MQLKLERFGLPNKPTETPEQLEELVRCGDWGRACEPSPLPPTPRGQPLSPLRRTAPLTQGSQGSPHFAAGTGEPSPLHFAAGTGEPSPLHFAAGTGEPRGGFFTETSLQQSGWDDIIK